VTKALTALVFLVVTIVAGVYWSAKMSDGDKGEGFYPWNVRQVDGTTEVFGLRLGQSTMEQGLNNFESSAEVSLFVPEHGDYVVEAFFDDVQLQGLGAVVVLVADLDQAAMQQMFARGERISTLGSGSRKVSLTEADLQLVRSARIASITYLPKIDLSAEQVLNRFGEPAQRIQENDSDAVHWLYPAKGLDVVISDDEKEVLQYLPPSRFAEFSLKLMQHGADVVD